MKFNHKTVLLNETVDFLKIIPNGIYVDGTAGGGGLSLSICKRLDKKQGRLVCIDTDPDAIEECRNRLSGYDNVDLVNENFVNMKNILNRMGIETVDGIVLDLGVSSYHLDVAQRGFSYQKEARLDMRMSKEGKSAYDVVNESSFNEIVHIIRDYGEEKFAKQIAYSICEARKKQLIESTTQLAKIITDSVPFSYRIKGHPARKTFQAIRIYVNNELENLKICLDACIELLKKNGILCVITFHSLEDRIVKHKMEKWYKPCKCPKDFPICICGEVAKVDLVTKKPVVPSEEEIRENRRSRSAKLRVCRKIV